jgi:CubicO group peptidase (beta-lactamase class C family)
LGNDAESVSARRAGAESVSARRAGAEWVGDECDPADVGIDPDGLTRALDLVRQRGVAAQLCVIRDGRIVLDRGFGCAPDSLFWVFSASKPYVAMLVHLLAERGALRLDDRVADHWPAFAQRGKQDITIRQVLRHRSGVPVARSVFADALAAPNWRRSVRLVERAAPTWPPGEVPAYHILSYGVILGELVQRVAGAPLRDILATEVLAPAGLRDTQLGLPRDLLPRAVPLRVVGGRGARARQTFFNHQRVRRAVIPAAGISATARDLVGFYQLLLDDGDPSPTTHHVFAAQTIAEARTPSTDNEVDRFLHTPVRWAQGFQLGGPTPEVRFPRAMGSLSSTRSFGHNGSSCCIGWADPTRRLAFAYVTDLLPVRREGNRHQAAVADAILAACG